MKLKTNLFLWIFPALAVPMAGLVLLTTAHNEKLFRQNINRGLFSSLNSVAVALNNRLHVEQDIIRGLANVPAVRQFIPVLAQLDVGRPVPDYAERREQLNRYLETFQSVRLSLNTVRVLDAAGNTLVMVRAGRRIPATLETLAEIAYVEEAPDAAGFLQALRDIGPDNVGAVVLPEGYYSGSGLDGYVPVMNTATPLVQGGKVVGYFTIDAPVPQLNRILDVAQRPYDGELLIVEQDSAVPGREGLVLYDDRAGIGLLSAYADAAGREAALSRFADTVYPGPTGIVQDPDGASQVYYLEMLPYPGSLSTWVIGLRVDLDAVVAPFFQRNFVILSGVAVALLLSLQLARAGAVQIASPIRKLAASMASYQRGMAARPVRVQGPDELRQAGEAFNLMISNLDAAEKERDAAESAMLQSAKLASIGQMAAGIGHEINNPLSNILSLTKLVERRISGADEVIRQDVSAIREEAERVSRIVNAILNFGRQSHPVRTRFETRPWLRETLELVEAEAAKRHITVESGTCEDIVLEGDRDLLQQTLVNLLLNALHASPEGGTVRVAAAVSGDCLSVSVADAGPGIAPEVAGNVFDPFFTTRPEGEGSGLGLSISLGIVQHHNGTLVLENNPEGGATATVTLPLGSARRATA
ncbi:MAG TPA: ATP-binding protein [Gammaproteobacteria bacterium]|nr:ATP-binding protein [Gammaproteobacteria bacterium]